MSYYTFNQISNYLIENITSYFTKKYSWLTISKSISNSNELGLSGKGFKQNITTLNLSVENPSLYTTNIRIRIGNYYSVHTFNYLVMNAEQSQNVLNNIIYEIDKIYFTHCYFTGDIIEGVLKELENKNILKYDDVFYMFDESKIEFKINNKYLDVNYSIEYLNYCMFQTMIEYERKKQLKTQIVDQNLYNPVFLLNSLTTLLDYLYQEIMP